MQPLSRATNINYAAYSLIVQENEKRRKLERIDSEYEADRICELIGLKQSAMSTVSQK